MVRLIQKFCSFFSWKLANTKKNSFLFFHIFLYFISFQKATEIPISKQICQRIYLSRKKGAFIWTKLFPKQVSWIHYSTLNQFIHLVTIKLREKKKNLLFDNRMLKIFDTDWEKIILIKWNVFLFLVTEFGIFNFILIFLSGLILNAVLMETCGISFVLPVSECDLKLTAGEKGVLNAIGFFGIICSSHLWGFLADTKGRRSIIQPTLFVAFLLSCVGSLVENFYIFVTLRFFNGFL